MLKAIAIVCPTYLRAAILPVNWCAAQTWLLGNTVSDALITSAMLYHVNISHLLLLQKILFETDGCLVIPQLVICRARDGRFNIRHDAVVSIVRLTVETNMVTSVYRL
jgi:hypothetical protein